VAEQGVPQAVVAGVRRPWRSYLILVLGIAATLAAIPLAEYLNSLIWDSFWVGTRWGQTSFYRTNHADGDLTDPSIRRLLYCVLFYLLPCLGFILVIWFRMKPILALLSFITSPFIVTALGLFLLEYQPSYDAFVFSVLACFFFGTIAAISLRVSEGPDSEAVDREEPIANASAGAGRHPLRAWIILALGFITTQAAVPLAKYLNEMIWEMLRVHFNTSKWEFNHHAVFPLRDSYYSGGLRYALHTAFLYLMPFLFLVLAIRLRMRPWYGWIFGLLSAMCIAGVFWLINSNSRTYELLSEVAILGQLFGIIGVTSLWFYHSNVSMIAFSREDDLEY
jgi:hypothetical protein